MLGTGKNVFGRAGFDLVAPVHDQHAVSHFSDHAHVVGDENHTHVHFCLQGADQLQDLRLNGHVQRGGWLVGNQQRRLARQCRGNHHALTHAARELVRKTVKHVARFGNAHQFQHAQGLGAGGGGAFALMHLNRFGNLVTRREHRIQRGHWLLKNHRDVGTANAAHGLLARLRQVQHLAAAAAKHHAAVDDAAATMLDQAHQRQRGDRFA